MTILQELNDGLYTGEIVDIITEETTDGCPKVTWRIRILDGENYGAFVEKKYYLKNQKVIDFLKKELLVIGHEIASSEDMEAKKADIVGTQITFSALNNDAGFLVFYVKGLASDKTSMRSNGGGKKKKAW